MSFRFQSTYIVKIGDDLGSATYWNLRLQDIDLRLNATESYAATINASADSISTLGIARINADIQPAITAIEAQIAALSTSVTTLQGLVITDQNNITTQLAAILVTANGLLANLESLGTIS